MSPVEWAPLGQPGDFEPQRAQKTQREKEEIDRKLIDDSFYPPVLQNHHVEIEDKTQLASAGFQIIQELRMVDGKDLFSRTFRTPFDRRP